VSRPVRVLLADDEALVRAGLRLILETSAELEVVGEAEERSAAGCPTPRSRPDST